MAAMQNLSGVPSVWGDLNLAGQNTQALSEAEQLQRKKKLMTAGTSQDFANATQFIYGRGNYTPAGTMSV